MKTQDKALISDVCWLFHKWSKWTNYNQPMIVYVEDTLKDTFELRQRRECKQCGKIQDKLVYNL